MPNFLAHAHLAGERPEVMLGALVADHLGRTPLALLDSHLADGVRAHRALDQFTDGHPAFRSAKALIAPPRRRFAGIIIDLVFDHLLARDWRRYADEALRCFIDEVYAVTRAHEHLLPVDAILLVQRMRDEDWLGCYESVSGIDGTLQRVAARVRRGGVMAGAIADLQEHAHGMQSCFKEFYADAMRFASNAPHSAVVLSMARLSRAC